jgi:hypothetical protein
MDLIEIPAQFVCQAWADGAHNLTKACSRASREITGDQLKMLLLRGERTLVGVADTGQTPKAWAAIQLQTLPNTRVLYVYGIYAPGTTGPEAMSLLRGYARANGCEVIRGACDPAVGRLWARKFDARPLYAIYEIEVNT